MRTQRILFVTILLMLVSSPIVTAQTPQSPPRWITFRSTNSKLEVGDIIYAYDASGTVCGYAEVSTKNSYSLSCRMDDFSTEPDEGIAAGEQVTFTINGKPAQPAFVVPTYIYNAQEFELDLQLGSAESDQPSCVDGYEPNDERAAANTLTGPEAHTFYSENEGWDQDWAKFEAQANWTYQIKARSWQPFGLTHPVLKLFGSDGTLIAENQLDKWGRGAEIWWWNNTTNQVIYVLVEENEGRYGCRHYNLLLQPFSPAEMQAQLAQ